MEWVTVFFCVNISNHECIKIDNIQWPSSYETSISYATEGDCAKNAERVVKHYYRKNHIELGYFCVPTVPDVSHV